MNSIIEAGASLETLYTGTTWAEGPAFLAATGRVRWSDIPGNQILELDTATGETTVYRADAEFANGRTLDLDGAVIDCSHGRRAVERDVDGVITTIVDRWQGHRLNSPNDVVVAADGAIWFTDPPYGIVSDYQGHAADPEYGGCFVFRYNESTGELAAVITDMVHPNGLAFSPDEKVLYVSDTSVTMDPNGTHHIRAYDVEDGACANGRVFAVVSPGFPDGFRVDVHGRVWTSSASGVQVFSPTGELEGEIPVPEPVANLCFGGDGQDLYITASTSLYRIRTTTTQASRPSR